MKTAIVISQLELKSVQGLRIYEQQGNKLHKLSFQADANFGNEVRVTSGRLEYRTSMSLKKL